MALLAGAYYVGAKLGLRLAFANRNVTTVWPPTGIAVAGLCLMGMRTWPAISIGALLANLSNGASLATASGITVGNTLAPLLAVFLLMRATRFQPQLGRVTDVIALVLLGGLFSMLVSATLGTTTLALTGALGGSFASTWTTWWVGDAMGVVLFAPTLLTLGSSAPPMGAFRRRKLEATLFVVTAPLAAFLCFVNPFPRTYLVVPFVIWGSLRFGQQGASVAIVAVSCISIGVAISGLGPSPQVSLTTELINLQLFNATLALSALILGALAHERAHARDSLQTAAEELEDRVRDRTAELTVANQHLAREMSDRVAAQQSLQEMRDREAEQLQATVDRVTALENAKSQFLALASHELRGPLAVARGYVAMYLEHGDGQMPPAMLPTIPIVAAKLGEMSRLIDQMLDVARLEHESLQLTMKNVDLRELARRAVTSIQPLAGPQHRVHLEDDGAPCHVQADGERIVVILTNLLSNALRYSPKGGDVCCAVSNAVDGTARVSVSDHGLGIAADALDALFSRFGRVVTRENANIPGTGLGLFLSRELARMHGGDISVVSTVGEGSTFTLSLPRVEAQDVADRGRQPLDNLAVRSGRRGRSPI